jgi:uncharacterized SAM-binding protein YcdF (DUF218 family)
MGTIVFYISKILRPFFTSPLPISLFIALWALIVLKPRNNLQTWLRRIGLCIILGTSLVSLPLVVRLISQWYEVPRSFSEASLDELAARGPGFYRAILLLGGTVDPIASRPGQVEVNDSFERITAAAQLYRAGLAPFVIASGGSGSITFPDQREAPYMAELLNDLGVPPQALIIEDTSRNTYENILYSKAILSERSMLSELKPVLLVSSAWHLPRALAICKKQGLPAVPVSVDSQAEPLLLPADLVPDPWALYRFTRLLREWIGLAAYRILGRL